MRSSYETSDFRSFAFTRHSYKRRGLYQEQLERYRRYFRSEQLLVLNFHDLVADLTKTLMRIYEFLSVDTEFVLVDREAKGTGSNRVDVDIEVTNYLRDYFRTPNSDLLRAIGNSSDSWKNFLT